ncbi:MAG: hypothetical protein AB4050_18675 [Synechococcus sp.]
MECYSQLVESWFELVGDIAWPSVVLIMLYTLRVPIGEWIGKITNVEFGAGDAKVAINAAEQASQIRQETANESEAAAKLLDLLERKDFRILRELIDEPEGRYLNIYRQSNFYRPSLDKLEGMGLIERPRPGRQYHLSSFGDTLVEKYIEGIMSNHSN